MPDYLFTHPNSVFTTTLTLTATGAGTASYSVKFSRNTTASWASFNLYNTANFSFTLNGGFPMAANYTYDFRTGGTERTIGSGTISGLPLATAMSIGGSNNPDNVNIGIANASGSFTTAGTPAPTTPTWNTNSAAIRPNATRGVAYSSTVTASPVTSYTNVSQSENTRGLSATANVISGTPTSVGTVEFTIRANNSTATNSRTFSITIDPAIPSFTDTTLATAIRDASYSDAVVADDTSNTGYSSTVSIPGLTFNSNGTITGTPTTLGTYNFVVTATNSIGSTNANVSLTVNRPTPVYTDSTVSSSATWGVAYTDGVEATDATNYAVVAGGDFPPGLELNATTGAITGVPTAVGSFTFQIRASNETGGVNTSSQTINVISPVRINTVTGPTGSFVTGAVNVNTVTGPTGSFVPGVVRIWNGTTWAPARLT